MNSSALLNILTPILEAAIQDPQTFIDADLLYRSKYRTGEVVEAGELRGYGEDPVSILCQELAAKDGLHRPEYRFDDESNEYEHEMYWDAIEQYTPAANELLAQGAKFEALVNYKGEGEGYASVNAAAKLQLFVSKYNYR